MTMQVAQSHDLELAAGLGALLGDLHEGLGIPGPYGANPATVLPAGTYEITGTGVNFRSAAGKSAPTIGTFNPDTSQGDKVVGTPDQVAFDGQTATADGLTWAHVTAKGQTGFVAVEYLGPVGWTSSHGGIAPQGGGGGTITPASDQSSSSSTTDYTVPILAAAGGIGLLIIGWAVFSKPKHGGAHHRAGRRRHAGRRRAH